MPRLAPVTIAPLPARESGSGIWDNLVAPSPMSLLYEKRPAFLGRTAVAGVGFTDLTKSSGATVGKLALSACRDALADCGLPASEVDGIVSFSLFGDSVPAQAV